MASVKKSGSRNSPHWVACYRLPPSKEYPKGKRVQKSTGLTDRNEAMIFALKLQGAVDQVNAGAFSHERAIALINEIAAAQSPVISDMPVTSYLNGYIAVVAKGCKESTERRYRAHAKRFMHFLQGDAVKLSTLNPALISSFRDATILAGLSAKTVRDCLVFLSSAFAEAERQKLILRNPVIGVKFPSRSQKNRETKKPFTVEQIAAMVALSAEKRPAGEWPAFIQLGYYTGQRQKDIAKLQVSQCHFDRESIQFYREKNSDDFEVPMHPALVPILKKLCEGRAPGDFVLPGIAGMAKTGSYSISDVFREDILPLIGIYPLPAKGGDARRVNPYSFHSLRHSFSTALNYAGASPEDRMRIVGHASNEVSRGYTHVALEHARTVLSRVPEV